MEPLSPEELAELRRLNTPSVSNAIEKFNLRPRNAGFMSAEVRCIFPEMGPVVGYACTATIMAEQPRAGARRAARYDYWDHLLSLPGPRLAVIQDLDQPTCIGSLWGEVNANIHKALGCVGAITNGGVRDLDEVRALGFQFFANAVVVSHSYVDYVDFGIPVKVGGVLVHPGDLLHADQHGVIVIPHECAREVARAAAEIEREERRIITFCQSPDFHVEGLKQRVREARKEA